MKLRAYCDSCKETRLVNGAEIQSLLKDGKPGECSDIVCQTCFWMIATITVGFDDGIEPVPLPLKLPRIERRLQVVGGKRV
jgi:hypothetical protein